MADNENVEAVDADASAGAESEFSGVIFNGVRDCYPPNADIECRYTIKPSVKATSRDWVGLFKVGWHSSREYSTYEWSPLVPDFDGRVPLPNKVLFRASYLPINDDEFYQFCYVGSTAEIRGASVPFQIKARLADMDLVCREADDDDCPSIMLVNTKTAVLEDSLSRALEENKVLAAAKENAEAELAAANEKILDLETGKGELTRQLNSNKENVEVKTKEVESLRKKIEQISEELQAEKDRRVDLETRLTEEQARRSDVAAMLDNANTKVRELSDIVEKERSESSEALKNKEKLVIERVQYLDSMAADREMMQKLRDELKVKDEEVNSLKARLSETRAKAKAEVGTLSALVDAANEKVAQIQEELAKERSTCENLRRATEMDVEKQTKKVRSLQSELRSKEQELREARASRDEQALLVVELQQATKESQEKSMKEFSAITRVLKNSQEESKVKQDCIHQLEDELEDMKQQLVLIKDKNTALEEDYEATMRALEDQLEGQKALNESLCHQSDNNLVHLQTQLQRQLDANADLSHQLEAKTAEVKQLEEALETYKKELTESEGKMEKFWAELSAADSKVRELEAAKKTLQMKLSDDNQQKVKQSKNFEAPMYALKRAQSHLEKKLLESEKERQNLWRERNDLKRTLANYQSSLPVEDLRLQLDEQRALNEDLRVRLTMGAEAYKMKFIECRKLQSQLKKFPRSCSTESVEISIDPDVQSVVSKLRQALDSERELVACTKSALEKEKQAVMQKDVELMKLQEDNLYLRERLNTTVKSQVQQSAESPKEMEEVCLRVERLQAELTARGAKLIEVEQDLQMEKCEKETIISEMKSLKEQLKESNSKLAEKCDLLVLEKVKVDSLEHDVRKMMQDRFDSEEELKSRMQKLGEEIERWKKECDMHVEAEAKLIGASSAEQQQQQQVAQGGRTNSPPTPHAGSPPQSRFQSPHWRRGCPPFVAAPSPAPQPWIFVPRPGDQETHPPPEAPPMPMPEPPAQVGAPGAMRGSECPICKVLFPPNEDISRIQEHVNIHFRD